MHELFNPRPPPLTYQEITILLLHGSLLILILFLGLKYEDFNVYGIHGAGGESDSPPDGPDDPSFPAGPSQR